MAFVLISLGSNLGNRINNLNNAIVEIQDNIGKVLNVSSVYESEAWGFVSENTFLNQVIRLNTNHEPDELLKGLLNIERRMGRSRSSKGYESRAIDLDILFYEDYIIDKETLKVPHPWLHERKFVLVPLDEIDAGLIHPVFKKSIHQLLNSCADKLWVKKFDSEQNGMN